MSKPLQIAFIGNARHLLHAFRAMTRYAVYASDSGQQYTFLLFGDFPEEILTGRTFKYQYIGEDREDMENFSDDYDVVLDPENDFKPGGQYALAQWFESKLNMLHTNKSAPFLLPTNHFHIRSTSFRLRAKQQQIGNTVMIMPPSPQDAEWAELPRCCPAWWAGVVETLDNAEYSIVYPQVKFASSYRKHDHRFFFTGYENLFCSKTYMPAVADVNDLTYHLVNARMFIGWDNIFADLAAALHIPSIIIRGVPRRDTREVFSVRNDEYILQHVYFSNPLQWDNEKLRKSIDFVESRLLPVSRPVSEYNRLVALQN